MAYTPFTWHDGPGGNTPITAARLNAIEQGIAGAHGVTDLLAPLVPHVAALLDGAVVDHNIDVPNPPNGYYVRWENGLQVCAWLSFDLIPWSAPIVRTVQGITFETHNFDWTFPAAFEGRPDWASAQPQNLITVDGNYGGIAEVRPRLHTSTTGLFSLITLEMDEDTLDMTDTVYYYAVGRWT